MASRPSINEAASFRSQAAARTVATAVALTSGSTNGGSTGWTSDALVDETGQQLKNALGTAGLDAYVAQTSSPGIGATGVILVEMTPTEAEQLINRLSG